MPAPSAAEAAGPYIVHRLPPLDGMPVVRARGVHPLARPTDAASDAAASAAGGASVASSSGGTATEDGTQGRSQEEAGRAALQQASEDELDEELQWAASFEDELGEPPPPECDEPDGASPTPPRAGERLEKCADEQGRLGALAMQQWRLSADGRTLACARGTALGDASVIVQLFAQALARVLEQHAAQQRDQERAARRRTQSGSGAAADSARVRHITDEEKAWEGGPGYNVRLANDTLHSLLLQEQEQGFTFTAAAVGDGSWHSGQNLLSRAALLHDGTELGGALATQDQPGGSRSNYDGELGHQVDVLAHLPPRSRLLYLFDSTSPVLAGEAFRESNTAQRARMQCDDWLGWRMEHENRHVAVVYWWLKSHVGHVAEAAVDGIAKRMLSDERVTPLPRAVNRHVSARGYARGAERELALVVAQLHLLRSKHAHGTTLRAGAQDADLMRHAQLPERDIRDLLLLRADRAGLQASRAYPDGGPRSHGGVMRKRGCPCGQGPQTREHLLWTCQLRHVQRIREAKLTPACRHLSAALGALDTTTGLHPAAAECDNALWLGTEPTATSVGGVRYTAADMRLAVLRLLLGLAEVPAHAAEQKMRAVRKAAKPVLCAVLDMLRYAETASIKATAAAAAHSWALKQQAIALGWLRAYTWLNPRPAGGPCRCCVPAVQRAACPARTAVHVERAVATRAVSDVAIRWAFVTAPSAAAGVPCVTHKLQVCRDAARAQLADAEACVVEAVALHAAVTMDTDPVVPAIMIEQPLALAPERTARRAALDSAMQAVRERRARVARAESALQWWPAFAAGSLAHARKRAACSARAAVVSKRAKAASPKLTAAQRAERDRAAKRKWEEELLARSVVRRRRAAERMRERADRRAWATPTVPVRHAVREAAQRQALAGTFTSVQQQHIVGAHDAGGTSAAHGSLGCTALGKRKVRPEEEARDARASCYARHIH